MRVRLGTMGILVVGSANMDLVVQAPHIPLPGETVLGHSFQTHPGGKGANQAVAAARLGAGVWMAGCVGEDAFGQSLRASLTEAGVDLEHLRTVATPTGVALIEVDRAGQNSIVVAPGANHEVQVEQVQSAIRAVRPRVVLVQLEIPMAVIDALPNLMPGEALLVLNPAPAAPLGSDVLQRVDVITPNEHEAEALTGISPDSEAATREAGAALLALGPKAVVITLGSKGCFVAHRNASEFLPPVKVDPVDTTGAGDAFNGALAAQLDQGVPLRAACEFANRVAALSTTRRGAQEAMPTRADLDPFAEEVG